MNYIKKFNEDIGKLKESISDEEFKSIYKIIKY